MKYTEDIDANTEKVPFTSLPNKTYFIIPKDKDSGLWQKTDTTKMYSVDNNLVYSANLLINKDLSFSEQELYSCTLAELKNQVQSTRIKNSCLDCFEVIPIYQFDEARFSWTERMEKEV